MRVTFSKPANGDSLSKRTSVHSRDSLKSYLEEIGRIPLLSASEEISLGHQVQQVMRLCKDRDALSEELGYGPSDRDWATRSQLTPAELKAALQKGERAKKRMIEANLRLVVHVAKQYRGRELDFLDLIQEGAIGLKRAVEKFDPAQGYKFSTYAFWWIRQGITRAIAEQSRTIKLPVNLTEKLNKIKRIHRELSQELGRTPTVNELSDAIDLPASKVRDYLQIASRPLSLDMRVGQAQDTELQELLQSNEPVPEEIVGREMLQENLTHLLGLLSPIQRDVIALRFGLEDGRTHTLEAVGKKLTLSRERVRQIQNAALHCLKRHRRSLSHHLDE